MFRIFTLTVLLAIFFTSPAFAYIDPGAASLALQALIAAIAGTWFFFQTKLATFGNWIRGKKKRVPGGGAAQPLDRDAQNRSDDQG